VPWPEEGSTEGDRGERRLDVNWVCTYRMMSANKIPSGQPSEGFRASHQHSRKYFPMFGKGYCQLVK
jgi:hypothetical protein